MSYQVAMLVLAALAPSTSSPTVQIDCPVRIELKEAAAFPLPDWELVEDRGNFGRLLETITLYDGHPSEMVSLVPDKSNASKGKLYSEWRLFHEVDRTYWIGCFYRNSMSMLAKPLPTSLKTCRLTQRLLPRGRVGGVESFACD